MKKLKDQVMKFKITKKKLKMEINLSDLVWLLKTSPNNVGVDGDSEYCHVRKGMNKKFAKRIVEYLRYDSPHDENNTRWSQPLEDIFKVMMETDEECLKY